jgi:hypothetical protein
MKNLAIYLVLITIFSCSNSNTEEMGLFDKLKREKKENSFKLDKVSEMMNEDQYWALVDNSLKHEQETFLVNELRKLSNEEIIGFRLRTDKLLYDTYNSEMWCAGYIMNGGCSDDGFEYFRCWVISRGRDTYYKSKDDPDYLIQESIEGAEYYDYEGFWYVALTAFEKNSNKNLYDYVDYDKFVTCEGKYPQFEFNWQEENPESMKAICPNLFDKFWN